MIPDMVLSSEPVVGGFLFPDNRLFNTYEDWELAGIAHQDPSQGLEVKVWRAWLDRDNANIYVQPADLSQPALFIANAPESSFISLAFDGNMRVAVAWRIRNTMYFYWYDGQLNRYVTTTYTGARSPRLAMDDKRRMAGTWQDVLLFYIRDNQLCMRIQRERYEIEHILTPVSQHHNLFRVGMSTKNRLQIEIR